MGYLDKLPAWARHILIVFGSTYAGFVLQAIIATHGVTKVAWGTVVVDGIDNAAFATATAIVTLYVTPLTTQYGLKYKRPGAHLKQNVGA